MKRLTIHDVAREAGVSHMTVSRVVRGIQSVSARTQARVQEAMERLGYTPDPALSALAAYRTTGRATGDHGVLAFLDCDQTEFSQRVMDGAVREARLLGYRIERFPLQPGQVVQKKLSRMLFHRGVRGLLFGPSDAAWTFTGWEWEEFAPVSLGALSHQPQMHEVAMDYFHGAFTACERLREQGCRRIGFAVDPALEGRTGHRWLGGYLASTAARQESPCCFAGDIHDLVAFRAWVRRHRIDGLLTIPATLAAKVPELKLAFLNDIEATPEQFCLHLAPAAIGAEGVRLVHHLLLRREYGLPAQPKMAALQGHWSSRGDFHSAHLPHMAKP